MKISGRWWRVVLCLFFSITGVLAQTNVWTKSSSGYWEEPYWSMGTLPATNQTILFSNAWQALAIGSSTVETHPESLSVAGLIISAPSNSFNQVLLNYAGIENPLTIHGPDYPGSLIVDSNSSFVVLASALQVGNGFMPPSSEYGAFSVGGTFSQGANSQLTAQFLHVGLIGPGVFNLTNGTVSIDHEFVGSNYPSFFNQFGGSNTTALQVTDNSQYNLYDGSFDGSARCWGGNFSQSGGTFSGSLELVVGSYLLGGGVFSTPRLNIPVTLPAPFLQPDGSFTQTGGTNLCGGLNIQGHAGTPVAASGSYTLSNGVCLVSGGIAVGVRASFSQWDGTVTNNGISLLGGSAQMTPFAANFTVGGGSMDSPAIDVSMGTFSQFGGSNWVTGNLSASGGGGQYFPVSSFNLSGGFLCDSNANLGPAQGGGFYQSGGMHVISNTLSVRLATYALGGSGQLLVRDIILDNGGTFEHSGNGNLAMTGTLTIQGALLDEESASATFGPMKLGYNGTTNSVIRLGTGPSSLHFANSSSQNWSSSATLTISNWNGSASGGGNHQIIFGNDSSALTSQQLGQISFINPAGSQGKYPAVILSNGEIVPGQFVSARRSGNALVLEWAPGTMLQTATNVLGPYQDLGVSSPYTISPTEPQRFYRVRQ